MVWFVVDLLFFGFLVGGLAGFIVTVMLFSRVGTMERRLEVIERREARALGPAPLAPPVYAPTAAGSVPEPQPRPEPVFEPEPEPEPTPTPTREEVREPVFAAEAHASAPQSKPAPRVKIDWEILAGGRFFNVVGAIVLIIGIGLLMKYAFDNNWIGAPLRVLFGVFAGTAAIVAGAFTHEKQKVKGRAWFAEGVLGTGLGILYVSGFTAFQSYHLLSFAPAFAFMSLVTLASFAIALRYGSLAMAVIGYTGGFLTPFAMGMSNVDEASLAAYLVFLDAGFAALVLVRREWFALQPLALTASYVTALYWYATYGVSEIPNTLVSTLALASLWFVFFASGVAGSLRESRGDATNANTTRAIVEIVNAIAFWSASAFVLAADRTSFAVVQAVVALGYSCAFTIVLRTARERHVLRARYLAGACAFLIGAIEAFAPHADLTAIYAPIAVVDGLIAHRLADRANRPLREAAFVGLGFLACAAIAALAIPGLAQSRHAWALTPGGRDFSLFVLAFAAFALDRLTRSAVPSDAPGIVLRQIGLIVIVALEALHLGEIALAEVLIATSIALASLQRVLRALGTSYAPKSEPAFASLALLSIGAIALFAHSEALWPAYGALDLAPGSRDVALLILAIGAFVLDRILRTDTSAGPICRIFRVGAMLSLLIFEALHAHELGLVTAFALTSMLLVALDRTLRAVGSSYGTQREVAFTAAALLAGAWFALLFGVGQLTYTGPGIFAGFGRADSTLTALVAASIVLLRVFASTLPPSAPVVLRQSIALALTLGAVKHATGLALWSTIGIEALGYAYVGTRRHWRDVEIDGIAFFAIALCGMLFEPAAWQARDLATFVLFHDERGVTLPLIAIAAIVAGEVYRRRSGMAFVGEALRLAGVATVVFEFTGEMRDAFERAVLAVPTSDFEKIAHIRDGEGLSVSGLWIVASIVVIALGVRFKVKDFRVAAIALFDLTILKAFFVDLSSLAPPYRILSFMGLGLTLLAVSYVYQRLERVDAAQAVPADETLLAT